MSKVTEIIDFKLDNMHNVLYYTSITINRLKEETNMKLKRMFGGLLATTLVASMALTGCGGSGNATSDTNAAADTKAAGRESPAESRQLLSVFPK